MWDKWVGYICNEGSSWNNHLTEYDICPNENGWLAYDQYVGTNLKLNVR